MLNKIRYEMTVYKCPGGLKIYGMKAFQLHRLDCNGESDPRKRFSKGDRVKYSIFGLWRLRNCVCGTQQRTGEVVGFGRKLQYTVRIKWDGNKTASSYAQSFIVHENKEMEYVKAAKILHGKIHPEEIDYNYMFVDKNGKKY